LWWIKTWREFFLGGYYGTGIVRRRGELISHFMLGVSIPNEDPNSKFLIR